MAVLPIGISGEEGGYQIERSLRFNSADTAYLNRTPSSTTNRRTFTYSTWVKRAGLGTFQTFIAATDSSTQDGFLFRDDNTIQINFNNITSSQLVTTQVFRDVSAWYHLVMSIDTTQATSSNRVKLYVNGVQVTAFSTANYPSQNYDTFFNTNTYLSRIGYSGLNSNPADMYMTEINFIDGSALDPTSFGEFNSDTGVWQPIEYTGSYGNNGFYLNFSDNSAATPAGLGKDYSGMAGNIIVGTSTSGSTTLSVVSLTGISVGNIVTGPGIPDNTYVVSTGALSVTLSQAATSSNTSTNYTFSGNNWTPNNFSVTAGAGNDSLVDTPTPYGTDTGVGGEVRGNYATLNPLNRQTGSSAAVLTNGNLSLTVPSGVNASPGAYAVATATQVLTTGKWYFEAVGQQVSGSAGGHSLGVTNALTFNFNGTNYYTASFSNTKKDASVASDILMIAYDADNSLAWVGKNGTWDAGNPSAGTGGTSYAGPVLPFAQGYNDTANRIDVHVNFGQRPFAYAAPTGFKALCTTNLPDPAIADGSSSFNTVLWTGDGSTGSRAITGVGFQPDFVWWKNRTTAKWHQVFDSNRGADKALSTNATDAEDASGGYGGEGSVTSFDTDGFTLQGGVGNNENGSGIVAWNWKAGGTGVSNTAGSITSTVSANPTAGFSIVTYTGTGSAATVGHGLGVTPAMYIVKIRSGANNWTVWHQKLANTTTSYILLDSTAAETTSPNVWGSTAATSSTIGIGTAGVTNASGSTYVAYCFAPVEGYSAFGSFVGNGSSTDGPFIFTGFRPKFILAKKTSATSNWSILDTARDGYNVADNPLLPNSSAAESTSTSTSGAIADILSNGFKVRGNSGDINDSGATYVYAAFAESPFKYSLAR